MSAGVDWRGFFLATSVGAGDGSAAGEGTGSDEHFDCSVDALTARGGDEMLEHTVISELEAKMSGNKILNHINQYCIT